MSYSNMVQVLSKSIFSAFANGEDAEGALTVATLVALSMVNDGNPRREVDRALRTVAAANLLLPLDSSSILN
jgi:hypothetical protein